MVKIAKALADPTRLRMVQELRAAGEMTCSQVCEKFPQSQPTISHHIKTLQSSGLIEIRREGQFHVLSVNAELVAEFAREFAAPAAESAEAARPRKARAAANSGVAAATRV